MTATTRVPKRKLGSALALALLVPLSACAASDGSSGDYDSYESNDTVAGNYDASARDDVSYEESSADEYPADSDESAANVESAPAGVPAVDPVPVKTAQALVITATVNMHADDVASAAAAVLDLVTKTGGVVESRNIVNDDYEDGTQGSATMTARIPPTQAEAFIDELGNIAGVDSVAQDAADVSDQLTDLDIRIENAEASVKRIRDLMDKATKIEDLANLEYELSNRQVNLEQLQAIKANLGNEVAMATIYISIRSTAELDTGPETPTDVSIVGAAKTGWQGFVEVVYSIVLVLATLWPVIVLAILAVAAFRWRRRRRKNRGGGDDMTPKPDETRPPETGPKVPELASPQGS